MTAPSSAAHPTPSLAAVCAPFAVTLRKNTALLGEGMAFIMLQDGAPGFGTLHRNAFFGCAHLAQ